MSHELNIELPELRSPLPPASPDVRPHPFDASPVPTDRPNTPNPTALHELAALFDDHPPPDESPLPPRLFSTPTHDAEDPTTTHSDPDPSPLAAHAPPPPPREWRLTPYKAHRTAQGVLVACHNAPNLGVPPPDAIQVVHGRAAQQCCWLDPPRAEGDKEQQQEHWGKFSEVVGERLREQFTCLSGKGACRNPGAPDAFRSTVLRDPCVQQLEDACLPPQRARRRATAATRRMLFYYNGRGVPRPTVSSEIWLFNEDHTQRTRACPPPRRCPRTRSQPPAPPRSSWRSGCTHAAPPTACCPASTPCWTRCCPATGRTATPPSARTPSAPNVPPGELNWVFNTITEAIAWNALPRDLFHRLFRADQVVAALARNFLLAERLLTREGVRPTTYPLLPATAAHPLWSEWDRVLDHFLRQVPEVVCGPDWQLRWAPCDHFFRHLDELRAHLDRPDPAMYLRPAPPAPHPAPGLQQDRPHVGSKWTQRLPKQVINKFHEAADAPELAQFGVAWSPPASS